MRKFRGITLFSILIFLQIVSILSLFAMQMALLETKQSQYLGAKHSLFYAAENILSEIERALQNKLPSCQITQISTEELMQHPLTWWQTKSCSISHELFHYYYVIEHLGIDACGYFQEVPPGIVPDYWRVTLMGLKGDISVHLQSTVILASEVSLPACQNHLHLVFPGRQMRREVFAQSLD